MSLMKLVPLSKEEVTSLYYSRMQNDFIENELKPFMVLKQKNCRDMDCNGLWEIYQACYRRILPEEMFEDNIEKE